MPGGLMEGVRRLGNLIRRSSDAPARAARVRPPVAPQPSADLAE
jgi:hypothetical protein